MSFDRGDGMCEPWFLFTNRNLEHGNSNSVMSDVPFLCGMNHPLHARDWKIYNLDEMIIHSKGDFLELLNGPYVNGPVRRTMHSDETRVSRTTRAWRVAKPGTYIGNTCTW